MSKHGWLESSGTFGDVEFVACEDAGLSARVIDGHCELCGGTVEDTYDLSILVREEDGSQHRVVIA